jgi:hypothetical protein
MSGSAFVLDASPSRRSGFSQLFIRTKLTIGGKEFEKRGKLGRRSWFQDLAWSNLREALAGRATVDGDLRSRRSSGAQLTSRTRRSFARRMTVGDSGNLRAKACFAALPIPRSSRVKMADRDCKSISCVGRLRNLLKVEQPRHHLLDLMFLSAAVSDHG